MPDDGGQTPPITTTDSKTGGLGRGDGTSANGAQAAAFEAVGARAKWSMSCAQPQFQY